MSTAEEQRDEALGAVRTFLGGLPEPSHEAIRAGGPSDELVNQASTYLELAFSGRWGLNANLAAGTQQAAVVLSATERKRAEALQLALQPHTLVAHSLLAPLVASILGDTLFPTMLAAIDDDEPERAGMAIYLARSLYLGRSAAPLTAGQADLLNAGVAVREQLPSSSPILQGALEAWLPVYATA